jgi:CBS domain containing-hemolysin-like protein
MKEGDSRSEHGLWSTVRALFGDNPEPTLREQIEEAIDEHEGDPAPDEKGDLSPVERQMVRNLLSFGKRTVDDVGVPRADIVAIPETSTFAELVAILADAPHSRLPVYRGSLDEVVGMIHIKDAFALLARGEPFPESILALIRQPLYVPQSMGVLDLLAEMRSQRIHLAIVIDEYSGTEGLVTIEDLVEEIVGDIEDETDDAVVPLMVQLDDGMWEADARAELEDVAETIDPRRRSGLYAGRARAAVRRNPAPPQRMADRSD